jgi:hypothetical protein
VENQAIFWLGLHNAKLDVVVTLKTVTLSMALEEVFLKALKNSEKLLLNCNKEGGDVDELKNKDESEKIICKGKKVLEKHKYALYGINNIKPESAHYFGVIYHRSQDGIDSALQISSNRLSISFSDQDFKVFFGFFKELMGSKDNNHLLFGKGVEGLKLLVKAVNCINENMLIIAIKTKFEKIRKIREELPKTKQGFSSDNIKGPEDLLQTVIIPSSFPQRIEEKSEKVENLYVLFDSSGFCIAVGGDKNKKAEIDVGLMHMSYKYSSSSMSCCIGLGRLSVTYKGCDGEQNLYPDVLTITKICKPDFSDCIFINFENNLDEQGKEFLVNLYCGSVRIVVLFEMLYSIYSLSKVFANAGKILGNFIAVITKKGVENIQEVLLRRGIKINEGDNRLIESFGENAYESGDIKNDYNEKEENDSKDFIKEIKCEFDIESPLIIVPLASASRRIIIFNLGGLTIQNVDYDDISKILIVEKKIPLKLLLRD